ncbi:MAG TPA: hypothetical protein VFC17_12245 [Candidatus Limnocylindrales bacterium]|nr:hypothetical protein [Candidatus Limnocylindrales bacterium]
MKKHNGSRLAPALILHSSFFIHHFTVVAAGECELRGKSSLLLSFLESVPDVAAKLKEPNAKDEKFSDVVKSAQDAAVLVLVY